MTAQATLRIVNDAGMHARASTRLVQTANHYRSEVIVSKDDQEVNGKSIMGVLLLVAARDTEITIRCEGDDAQQCLDALSELVRDGFGED